VTVQQKMNILSSFTRPYAFFFKGQKTYILIVFVPYNENQWSKTTVDIVWRCMDWDLFQNNIFMQKNIKQVWNLDLRVI